LQCVKHRSRPAVSLLQLLCLHITGARAGAFVKNNSAGIKTPAVMRMLFWES